MKRNISIFIISIFFFSCGKSEKGGIEDIGWNDFQDVGEGFEVNIVSCDPNPCKEQNRTVCVEKEGTQFCLCDEGYYSDKSEGPCTKIEEPTGKEQKTVSNENVSVEVTIADYKGRVSLPIGLSGYNISSYFGEDSPVGDDGKFELKMNTEASGLILLKTPQGSINAFIVFPKSADLRNENPEINSLNIAASMVFMQPGITLTDPIVSAILLEAIKTFDETKYLASIIEGKISEDPDILSKNDPEIVTALAKAVNAILNYKPQTELALKISGLVKSDTCSDLFCDSDGKDGDKVSIEAKIDKEKKSADFNVTNYLSRWVFFYIDKKDSTNPVLCLSDECFWAGAVSPRKFELPTIKALIVDAILKNLGGAIWNLFTGKSISEILEDILNNAVTAVTKNFAPTDNSFSADLSGFEDSLFTSYSMGKGMTSAKDYRWLPPAFLTGLTELILPGLEIAVDMGFTKITLKTKKDMKDMAKLIELLISKFPYDISEIFLIALVEKNYFKASGKFIDFFLKLATEPEFYKWLSKYGPISGSKLGKMVANAIADVINKVYNPLEWIDTGIKLANFLFSGVKIVEIVAVEDYKDQYFIKLPACKPDCAGKECGDNGCGGSCGSCSGGKECVNNKCICVLNKYKECYGNSVYWFDSCGNKGEKISDCPYGCENAKCKECKPNCTNKECGDDGCGGKCGTCNTNYICEGFKCKYNPSCGNSICDTNETYCSCPSDCSIKCGDGCCSSGEDFAKCPQDCECIPNCTNKECGDDGCGGECGTCNTNYICEGFKCKYNPSCGNSICDTNETYCSCPSDCSIKCGDGCCSSGEDFAKCPQDCECIPNCTNKECGSDGCGGSCGNCNLNESCVEGICLGKHIFSKRFGSTTGYDSGNSVSVDSNGNVFVTGDFGDTVDFGGGNLESAGGADIFLAKYDGSGNHLWSKKFGSTDNDLGNSVSVDSNGNVFVTGDFEGTVDFGGGNLTGAGWQDIFLAKFDGSGNHLWSKRFGWVVHDSGNSVSVDSNGNVFVTGDFAGTVDFGGGNLTSTGGSYDIFLAKFDGNGNHLWSKKFGSTSDDGASSVSVDSNGNVFVTGAFHDTVDFGGGNLTSAGLSDIFLAKFDGSGNHLWSKKFGSTDYDSGYSVSVDSNGNVFVTGKFWELVDFGGGNLESAGWGDIFLAKFDGSGNHLWSKQFGYTFKDGGYSVSVDSNGNVFVTGKFWELVDFGGGNLESAGKGDIFLAKFDGSGKHIWSKKFGSAYDYESGNSVSVDSNGNVFVTGVFYGTVDFGGGNLTSAGKYDIFLIKYSP